MNFQHVQMESIGYELPAMVVTSEELEERLMPAYDELHIAPGQLEALTGICERRWWDPGFALSDGAAAAAKRPWSSLTLGQKTLKR